MGNIQGGHAHFRHPDSAAHHHKRRAAVGLDQVILHLLSDRVLPKLRVADFQSLSSATKQLRSLVNSASPSSREAVAHASLPAGHSALMTRGTPIKQACAEQLQSRTRAV